MHYHVTGENKKYILRCLSSVRPDSVRRKRMHTHIVCMSWYSVIVVSCLHIMYTIYVLFIVVGLETRPNENGAESHECHQCT